MTSPLGCLRNFEESFHSGWSLLPASVSVRVAADSESLDDDSEPPFPPTDAELEDEPHSESGGLPLALPVPGSVQCAITVLALQKIEISIPGFESRFGRDRKTFRDSGPRADSRFWPEIGKSGNRESRFRWDRGFPSRDSRFPDSESSLPVAARIAAAAGGELRNPPRCHSVAGHRGFRGLCSPMPTQWHPRLARIIATESSGTPRRRGGSPIPGSMPSDLHPPFKSLPESGMLPLSAHAAGAATVLSCASSIS